MRDGQKKSSEPAGSAAEEKPGRSPVPLASRKSSRTGDDDDQVTIPPSSRQASPQHGQQPIRNTPPSSSEFATDDYRLTITLDPNQQNSYAISIAIIDLHHGNNYRTVIMPNHLVTHLEPAEATPIVISGQLPVPLQQIQGFYGFLSESFRRIIDNDTTVGEGVSGVIQHQRNVNEALSSYLIALSFCAGSGWAAVSFSCDICVALVPHASEESRLQASLDILRYETREKEAKLEREVAQLKGIVETLLQQFDYQVQIVDPCQGSVMTTVNSQRVKWLEFGEPKDGQIYSESIPQDIQQSVHAASISYDPPPNHAQNVVEQFKKFLYFHLAKEIAPMLEGMKFEMQCRPPSITSALRCSSLGRNGDLYNEASPLTMFSPLRTCIGLKALWLYVPSTRPANTPYPVLDTSFITSLVNLEVLLIANCRLIDLEFLRPLKRLRKLFLHNIDEKADGSAYDLRVLTSLPELQVVSLFDSEPLGVDVSPLLEVESLQEVMLKCQEGKIDGGVLGRRAGSIRVLA